MTEAASDISENSPRETKSVEHMEVVGSRDSLKEFCQNREGSVILALSGGDNGVNAAAALEAMATNGLLVDSSGNKLPIIGLSGGVMAMALFAVGALGRAPELFTEVMRASDARNFPKIVSEKSLLAIRDKYFPDIVKRLRESEQPLYAVLTRADNLSTALVDLRDGTVFIEKLDDEEATLRKRMADPDIPLKTAMDLAKRLKEIQDQKYEGRDKLHDPNISLYQAMNTTQIPLMGRGDYQAIEEKADVQEVLLAAVSSIMVTGTPGRSIATKDNDGVLNKLVFADGAFGRAGYVPIEAIIGVLQATNYQPKRVIAISNYKYGEYQTYLEKAAPLAHAVYRLRTGDQSVEPKVPQRMLKAVYSEYDEWFKWLHQGKARTKEGAVIDVAALYPPQDVTPLVVVGGTEDRRKYVFDLTKTAVTKLIEEFS